MIGLEKHQDLPIIHIFKYGRMVREIKGGELRKLNLKDILKKIFEAEIQTDTKSVSSPI